VRPMVTVVIRRNALWSECDPAGIVHTPRFSDYVAKTYLEFMKILFGSELRPRLALQNLALPAKAIGIEFKRSLRPGRFIDLHVRVRQWRTRTFDIGVTAYLPEGLESFDGTIGMGITSTPRISLRYPNRVP
jgi:acyl-CoA thioesterase FadM